MGHGPPIEVDVGHVSRELCDGQSDVTGEVVDELATRGGMPFPSDEVKNLKAGVVQCDEAADRTNTPIDFRFLQLLLTVAGDPDFSLGVRVGPGARLPRLPALYPAKKRWRLSEQGNPRNYLEQVDTVSMWRTNCASLDVFSAKVLAVLEDQATRGQVIKMTEHEARQRYRLTQCPEERQTRGSRVSSGTF